jgi:alkaline phosphatase
VNIESIFFKQTSVKQLLILPLLLLFSFQKTGINEAVPTAGERPKNIILMIGDGMGLTQITAGLYSNGNSLHLEKFPVTGLITTHASNKLVTDSGAGATAFSCGCKTFNGAIGVCKDETPCLTILEQAEQQGLATGLVATSSITHATPASFIAHVPDRSEMEAIAAFFLQTDIDLIIGGGLKYFNQRSADQRNLVEELIAKGFEVSNFSEKKLSDLTPAPDRPFAWFSAMEEPESVLKGRDYLPLAARLSSGFLAKRSEKGFFLMIEGSQIDWACHAKNATYAVREMLDFDAAIAEALKFAEVDGHTLVIVTADHETGGMALEQGRARDSLDIEFNTAQHTASLVPVFAYGPGAERFGGVYDNTGIYMKMRELFGFPAVVEEKLKGN